MSRYDATRSSGTRVALDEHGEAGKDVTLVDERRTSDTAYQLYVLRELENELESQQVLTDGGQILRNKLCRLLMSAQEGALALMRRGLSEQNTVEAARLTNAAARLMNFFQQGMLTLHTVQAGKDQPIAAQQVNVSGGNVLVAANVSTGAGPASAGAAEEI